MQSIFTTEPIHRVFGRELTNLPTVYDQDKKKTESKSQKLIQNKIEISSSKDLQSVELYIDEIYTYLRSHENFYDANPMYMSMIQVDINEKMRSILVDWLVDVHLRFKLREESLHLTVNLIDRYLQTHQVNRQKLQLVGVSALLIACKFEEIYAPEIKDLIYITDRAYSKEDILEMEGKILSTLEFNLTFISSLSFLDRYTKLIQLDEKPYFFAKYLIQLALIEYRMLRFSQSLIAAGAIYLIHRIKKLQFSWEDFMKEKTGYDEQNVRICAKELCLILQNIEKSNLQAIRRKFSGPKFRDVSRIQK